MVFKGRTPFEEIAVAGSIHCAKEKPFTMASCADPKDLVIFSIQFFSRLHLQVLSVNNGDPPAIVFPELLFHCVCSVFSIVPVTFKRECSLWMGVVQPGLSKHENIWSGFVNDVLDVFEFLMDAPTIVV